MTERVVWSQFVETPAEAGGGEGWVQWADPELAMAWWRLAADLSSEASELAAASHEPPWPGMIDLLKRAWTALGNGYRACDLPCYADPEFLRIVKENARYSANGTDGRWKEMACRDRCCYEGVVSIMRPFWINPEGELLESDPPPIGAGLNERWWSECNIGRSKFPCGVWGFYRWRDPECGWRGFAWDPCESWNQTIYPPLVWSLYEVREIARACLDRGPLRTIRQVRINALSLNIRKARAAGVLRGRTDWSRLEGLAEQALTEAREGTGSDWPSVRNTLVQAAFATAAAVPALAAVAGVAAAFISLFTEWGAVGHVYDWTGYREEPVLERNWISGGPGVSERPTHDVPVPEGWVRGQLPPEVTLSVLTPTVTVEIPVPAEVLAVDEVLAAKRIILEAEEAGFPVGDWQKMGPERRAVELGRVRAARGEVGPVWELPVPVVEVPLEHVGDSILSHRRWLAPVVVLGSALAGGGIVWGLSRIDVTRT